MHGFNHNNTTQKPLKSFNINRFNFVIPLMATVGLFAGGVAFLNPLSFVDNSYADSTNTDISINIGEVIVVPEVSTDSINIELDPAAAGGDFKTASVTVGVSTNRTAGYTLTANVEGSETALTNADYDNYEIGALSGKTSASDFADLNNADSMNKWGYATDNNGTDEGQTEAGYYYAMPDADNPTTLKVTDGPANTSNTEVTFATKGKNLAAGKYENTVVFTAVGNLESEPTMQSFTTEQCDTLTEWSNNGSEGDTISLTDSRDKATYKIRKLADEHCWMISNLAITNFTISENDSDYDDSLGSFTIPATSGGSSQIGWVDSYTAPYMHIGNAADDGDNGWIEESGPYYNWNLATAGQGSDTTTSSVNYSICPRGWKLPLGDTSEYSWYYLAQQYGYTGSGSSFSSDDFVSATNTSRFGGVYARSMLTSATSHGNWWSRTPNPQSNTTAYDLYIQGSNSIFPRSGDLKSYAPAIRCVFVGS